MKTIGVLGGLGPQATMAFEALVHRSAQRLLPQRANSGYPPMLVAYHRGPLLHLGADGIPQLPPRPDDGLLKAANLLGRSADFLVLASNGAHRFTGAIESAAGKPVLDLISLVLAEVGRRGWRNVGVLTFFDAGIYADPLLAQGLRCETIGAELQRPLDAAIYEVMEGRSDAGSVESGVRAVQALRARATDGIILGCTEIPLLLPEEAGAADCIDPLPILAEAAVLRAIADGP
jgi:aspartate racemase